MTFVDQKLTCRECAVAFVFTAGEQAYLAERRQIHAPQQCPDCRGVRPRRYFRPPSRERPSAVCAACGSTAHVTNVPQYQRPVYCDPCFAQVCGAALA